MAEREGFESLLYMSFIYRDLEISTIQCAIFVLEKYNIFRICPYTFCMHLDPGSF